MHYLTLLMTHVKPEGDCYKRLQEILKPFDKNNLEINEFTDYKECFFHFGGC